jgi:predicted kinase
MPKTHRRVQQNIPNIKITQDGVAKHLRNINPSKASGPDNISNRVLKQCADHLASTLTIIYSKVQ